MWSRSGSRLPRNITWSNTEVLPACVEALPVSDSPCGFVDCVLWGMLIRLSALSTWAEIHQNICEVDLWLIEGLISSPLVFIRRRNGGKAGGVPGHGKWSTYSSDFPATGSDGDEPLHLLIRSGSRLLYTACDCIIRSPGVCLSPTTETVGTSVFQNVGSRSAVKCVGSSPHKRGHFLFYEPNLTDPVMCLLPFAFLSSKTQRKAII